MLTHPVKSEKVDCPHHVSMLHLVELDVMSVPMLEALRLRARGEAVPTEKQWVAFAAVQLSVN